MNRCVMTNDEDFAASVLNKSVCSNPQQWFKTADPRISICDACFSQLDPDVQLEYEPIF